MSFVKVKGYYSPVFDGTISKAFISAAESRTPITPTASQANKYGNKADFCRLGTKLYRPRNARAPERRPPTAPRRHQAARRSRHLECVVCLFGGRSPTHSLHSTTELGGPTSDPESGEANGSMLVFEAESAAAVRATLEKDPYWTGNVVRVVFLPSLLAKCVAYGVGELGGTCDERLVVGQGKGPDQSDRPCHCRRCSQWAVKT